MKAIVIGTSLSGKTTIIRQLRLVTKIPVSEMDEELTRLNGGNFPTDSNYKHNVLVPQVIESVLNKDKIIFFTNTDYFTFDDLQKAKQSGFKIIQLVLDRELLNKRNEQRIRNEGYEDLSKWFDGMLKYQKLLEKKGLVDNVIQAGQPSAETANEILNTIS